MDWTAVDADERAGCLRAEARTAIFHFVDDVEVRVTLDADGQTRVDMSSISRVGPADLGTNRRRIRRYMRTLDASMGEP